MSTNKQVGFGVIFLIIFIGAIIILVLGFDKVDADKVGVKDRFGVVLGKMDSGLQWTGLFVSVTEYPLTIQKILLSKVEAVDKTGQSVFSDIAVNYKIRGGKQSDVVLKLYQEVATSGDMPFIEDRLAMHEKIQESFKQVTVQYEALEILEKRDEVREKTTKRIEELFPKEYFEIVSITVTNIGFVDSFEDAIQLKKDNTQLALAAQERVKQSEAEANQKIEQARGEAESKKLNADSIAYELRVQRSEITPLMVQRNWIDKWNGQLPQTLFTNDGKEGGSEVNLLLPIK